MGRKRLGWKTLLLILFCGALFIYDLKNKIFFNVWVGILVFFLITFVSLFIYAFSGSCSIFGIPDYRRKPERVLNLALCGYINRTVPSLNGLRQWISRNKLEKFGEEIEAKLTGLSSAVENYLYDQKGGVQWSEPFELKMFEDLRQKHPWLDRVGYRRLISFSRWYCWHEGLEAPNSNKK